MTLRVVHSLPTWLPLTSPWLYQLVIKAPADVVSHVVCLSTANLPAFPFANLHCLSDRPLRFRWETGLRRWRLRRHMPFLVETVQRTESTIVHSHWGDAGWADGPSVHRAGAQHVVTFYGKDVNFLPRQDVRWLARYRELFEAVSLVICEGPHMGQCIAALGCDPAKIRVHHLGVENDKIAFKPRRWNPRSGGPLRILIAASFREKKGIPLALTALARLRRRVPELFVTVVGDSSADPRSVPEKQRILAAIQDGGLTDRVRLLGYRPHDVLMAEAYQHHIFLSPSLTAADGDTEGGAPVSLLDMAASGMPIVSSTHCDIPHLIQHGVTGWLAREADLEALVAQLEAVVADPQCWEEVVHAGRQRTEQEFDAAVQACRLADLYRSLS
jgi:colanic acid/amylovoran biosynthesis glycosyltransferase